MNFIDNIEIKNFKSIRHQKIEGCKRVNVFIGYPNVGKSNILEALSGFSYAHKPSLNFHSLCRYETFRDLIFNGDVGTDNAATVILNDKIVLRYKFYSPEQLNINAIIYESNSLKAISFDEIDIEKESKNSFSFLIDKEGMASGAQYNNESFLPIIKKYDFDKSKNKYKFSGDKSLSIPFGNNLPDIIESNREIRKQVAELFNEYNLKMLLERGDAGLRIAKTFEDETIFSIPFHHTADTLQRVVFQKAAILSNKGAILLFEEPEAHMFPPYIAKFTADVMFDKNDNQYFIATHSPFVLNDFMEDMEKEELSIYVVGLKDGETIVRK